jgi:hypothetical protein
VSSHATINALVVNRVRREKLQAELTELWRERADLIDEARAAGVPRYEIEGAAGRTYEELDAAQDRAARSSTRH